MEITNSDAPMYGRSSRMRVGSSSDDRPAVRARRFTDYTTQGIRRNTRHAAVYQSTQTIDRQIGKHTQTHTDTHRSPHL